MDGGITTDAGGRQGKHAWLFAPAVIGLFLRAGDLFIVALSGLAAYSLYLLPDGRESITQYLTVIVVAVLIAGVLFRWFGVYGADFVFAKRLQIGRTLLAWAAVFGTLLAFAFALKISVDYSRVWATVWFGTAAFLFVAGRLALAKLILRWTKEQRFACRTVIVGVGKQGNRLAAHLRQHTDDKIKIIGFIDDRKDRGAVARQHVAGQKILGDFDTLMELVRRGVVDQIFIALPWDAENRVRELAQKLSTAPVRICLALDLVGFQFSDKAFERVAGVPVMQLFDRPINGWSHIAKTIEDWVLGILFLALLAPVMVVIALIIKCDSPGPVFFRQKRQGFNGNTIDVWKFRTMRAEMADPDCNELTRRNDPRVTRTGRYLRRCSLDELPQLFNVLSGDMSIIGPRPHAPKAKAAGKYYWDVVDQYAARHRVKPGITGWAQVNGWRGETDTVEKIQKRVEHDLYYIENWSIWFDLMIIVKTPFALLRRENAW